MKFAARGYTFDDERSSDVVDYLARHRSATRLEIAERLGLKTSELDGAIRELEQLRLIRSTSDDAPASSFNWLKAYSLTGEGVEFARSMRVTKG